MNETLRNKLKTPEAKYLGKPFWAWNGDLEETELLRQIEVMKEMGFGGYFMHSRTGLITEYLGERWFSLVRACAKYGKSLGMEAWLYDEDRWPSGTCGGLVTQNPDFRQRFISEYDDDETALGVKNVVGILCRYALLLENGELKDARRVEAAEEVPAGYLYKVYAEELMEESAFYNGTAYLDTMNPAAVEAFLKSTHDRYEEECGNMFGEEIRGIFTDEPHRGPAFFGFGISNENKDNMTPYTGALFSAYLEKYKEELCIPEIYYRKAGEEENQTAFRYLDVLDDLFTGSFAKLYEQRCHRLGLKFTGHILHEDSLDFQTGVSGSMMRFYEYMDYPGMDNLSAHNGCYWVAVQCASVARQLDKPFVLSELYGCTGWDMPLNEYKRIGDWQALFGVNLRCPHLSWYSMWGEAKRDYPASILHQNAWYRDWHELETYFGRIGMILSEGERKAELLVIHPVEAMWRLVYKGWMKGDPSVQRLDREFQEQCLELIAAQQEFDYGDEELMRKYGSVGQDEKGAYLRIGSCVYRYILLAEGQKIRESTRTMIDEFVSLGGKVAAGTEDLPAGEVLSAPKGIASAIRRYSGESILFLMNLSEKEKTAGAVVLTDDLANYAAEEWDMVSLCPIGKADLSNLSFEAGEMKIFLLKNFAALNPREEGKYENFSCKKDFHEKAMLKKEEDSEESEQQENTEETVELPEKLPFTLSEPNVLVLDHVRYLPMNCPIGEELKDETDTDVLLLDRKLREKYGLVPRGGEMIQPWFAQKYYPGAEETLERFQLEYRFDSEIDTDVFLAAEYDSLTVNGEEALVTDRYWVDKCFKIFSAKLKKGENIISVPVDFKQSTNLEAVYVLGDFGVQLPNRIVPIPDKLSPKNIEKQGLPFYSGAVCFYTGVRTGSVTVHVDALHGADVHLSDGTQDEIIAFPPYEKSLSLNGELVVTLECTRRNTFGPHHLVPYPRNAYGPDAWISEGKSRTEDYVITEQGVEFTVRKKSSFC